MEPELAGFFEQYLNAEVAYGYLDRIKGTVEQSYAAWGRDVQRMFQQLLTERSISPAEYCDLTFIEFESSEELYSYLGKVYEFFFLGGTEVPLPPD